MQGMDEVRFLDNVDITLSMDSTQSSEHQMTNIELGMRPVTLRASIVDINLITSIVLRALALYSQQNKPATTVTTLPTRPSGLTAQSTARTGRSSRHTRAKSSLDKPRVHLAKEKVQFITVSAITVVIF